MKPSYMLNRCLMNRKNLWQHLNRCWIQLIIDFLFALQQCVLIVAKLHKILNFSILYTKYVANLLLFNVVVSSCILKLTIQSISSHIERAYLVFFHYSFFTILGRLKMLHDCMVLNFPVLKNPFPCHTDPFVIGHFALKLLQLR